MVDAHSRSVGGSRGLLRALGLLFGILLPGVSGGQEVEDVAEVVSTQGQEAMYGIEEAIREAAFSVAREIAVPCWRTFFFMAGLSVSWWALHRAFRPVKSGKLIAEWISVGLFWGVIQSAFLATVFLDNEALRYFTPLGLVDQFRQMGADAGPFAMSLDAWQPIGSCVILIAGIVEVYTDLGLYRAVTAAFPLLVAVAFLALSFVSLSATILVLKIMFYVMAPLTPVCLMFAGSRMTVGLTEGLVKLAVNLGIRFLCVGLMSSMLYGIGGGFIRELQWASRLEAALRLQGVMATSITISLIAFVTCLMVIFVPHIMAKTITQSWGPGFADFWPDIRISGE